MEKTQDKIFLESEGDKWYKRNKMALKAGKSDIPMMLMELYDIEPTRVLEVGASNGYRLAEIYKKYGCEVYGLEPSKDAIEEGGNKYGFIKFQRNTAENMEYKKQFFDLIILNSVFHWIDRETLLMSIGNIDRTLQWGGI